MCVFFKSMFVIWEWPMIAINLIEAAVFTVDGCGSWNIKYSSKAGSWNTYDDRPAHITLHP